MNTHPPQPVVEPASPTPPPDAAPTVAVPSTAFSRRAARHLLRRLTLVVGVLLPAALAGVAALAAKGGSYRELTPAIAPGETAHAAAVRRLESRLAALAPRGLYLVVDSHRNRLRLMRDGELQREMVCSTGSGTVLRDPRGDREWIFDTPIGERRVERKVRDPVWVKPDWAFVEEGYEPPEDPSLRYDRMSLGDYALYLGDGYLIHGTLFQTLLGRRLTHGCIRLGDDDLEYVYKTVPLGTRVLLY